MAAFSDGTFWSDLTDWSDTAQQSPLKLEIVAASAAIAHLDDLLSMIDTWSLAEPTLETKMQAIAMCETEMNDRLRIQTLENADIFKARSGGLVLPIDVRSVRQVYAQGGRAPLRRVQMDTLQRLLAWGGGGGPPCQWAVNGHVVSLYPAPAEQLEFLVWYYRDVAGLSVGNTLNAILARHPHIYFSGAMKWVESFLQNSERSAEWGAIFYGSMDKLVMQDRMDRTGPAPLVGRYGSALH